MKKIYEKCSLKHFVDRLKVKFTLEGHINKLVRAITPAQVFSLRSSSAI